MLYACLFVGLPLFWNDCISKYFLSFKSMTGTHEYNCFKYWRRAQSIHTYKRGSSKVTETWQWFWSGNHPDPWLQAAQTLSYSQAPPLVALRDSYEDLNTGFVLVFLPSGNVPPRNHSDGCVRWWLNWTWEEVDCTPEEIIVWLTLVQWYSCEIWTP